MWKDPHVYAKKHRSYPHDMPASPSFGYLSFNIIRYSSQSSPKIAQPMPTYLNQLGRQSSLFSHDWPSVKRPVTQPLHLGELGQLK
jgi:hypothetical protein